MMPSAMLSSKSLVRGFLGSIGAELSRFAARASSAPAAAAAASRQPLLFLGVFEDALEDGLGLRPHRLDDLFAVRPLELGPSVERLLAPSALAESAQIAEDARLLISVGEGGSRRRRFRLGADDRRQARRRE